MSDAPHGRCDGCNVPLLQPHGYEGAGLCGPCCTGEADSLEQVSYECSDYKCRAAHDRRFSDPAPRCWKCNSVMVLSRKAEIPL
jgi:hypothetical protein